MEIEIEIEKIWKSEYIIKGLKWNNSLNEIKEYFLDENLPIPVLKNIYPYAYVVVLTKMIKISPFRLLDLIFSNKIPKQVGIFSFINEKYLPYLLDKYEDELILALKNGGYETSKMEVALYNYDQKKYSQILSSIQQFFKKPIGSEIGEIDNKPLNLYFFYINKTLLNKDKFDVFAKDYIRKYLRQSFYQELYQGTALSIIFFKEYKLLVDDKEFREEIELFCKEKYIYNDFPIYLKNTFDNSDIFLELLFKKNKDQFVSLDVIEELYTIIENSNSFVSDIWLFTIQLPFRMMPIAAKVLAKDKEFSYKKAEELIETEEPQTSEEFSLKLLSYSLLFYINTEKSLKLMQFHFKNERNKRIKKIIRELKKAHNNLYS